MLESEAGKRRRKAILAGRVSEKEEGAGKRYSVEGAGKLDREEGCRKARQGERCRKARKGAGMRGRGVCREL